MAVLQLCTLRICSCLLLLTPLFVVGSNQASDPPEEGLQTLEEEMRYLKVALLDRMEALSYKLEWALGAGNPPLNASRFLQMLGDMKGRLNSIENSVANGRCEHVTPAPPPVCPTCPRCPVCPVCPVCRVCPPRVSCRTCPRCPVCRVCPVPFPPRPPVRLVRSRRRRIRRILG